eukprot:scaffold1437_cov353-Prasinococcus_capsulatus_cf.AAC.13
MVVGLTQPPLQHVAPRSASRWRTTCWRRIRKVTTGAVASGLGQKAAAAVSWRSHGLARLTMAWLFLSCASME